MKLNTAITIAVAATLSCAVIAPQFAHAQEAEATTTSSEVKAIEGQMLYAKGKRLASVYRVGEDGNAYVILGGKMYVIPASTLSIEDGKLNTSLSKGDVIRGAS